MSNYINNALLDASPLRKQKDESKALVSKWDKTGLLDGLNEDFKKNGMEITGVNKKLNLVEIIELKNHPWFLGTQYHPEYKSTVLNPHPLFISFVKKIKILKNGQ